MKYILVDAQNLFHRSKHVTHGEPEIKAGMALHIIFNSILKCWRMFGDQKGHVVVALEGRSWRKEIFTEYKIRRMVQDNLKSQREKDEDAIFFEVMNDFSTYMKERTNCSVLQSAGLEADDLIARWIQLHPQDEHIIVSSDTDFYQMLAPNVTIYNGIKGHTITINSVVDDKGKQVVDKKSKQPLVFDPEWELFHKCMKGDPGDGIWKAVVPRTRDTKIREAYDDRVARGYSWNNLMFETWEDHTGTKDTVLNRYKRNIELIDLSAQPQEIKDLAEVVINEAIEREPRQQVGTWFLKFCNKHNLQRLAQNPNAYAEFLNASVK